MAMGAAGVPPSAEELSALSDGVALSARLVDTPTSELHTDAFIQEAKQAAEASARAAEATHLNRAVQHEHRALVSRRDPHVKYRAPHRHGGRRRLDGVGAFPAFARDEPEASTQRLDSKALGLAVAAQHLHVQNHPRIGTNRDLRVIHKDKLQLRSIMGPLDGRGGTAFHWTL